MECTAGRVFLESQSWWSDSRVPFPGAHIHLGTCFPLTQVVTGTVPFEVMGMLHNQPGTVNILRLQVWNNGSQPKYQQTVNWSCATNDCTRIFPFSLNTTGFAAGRYEVRMTLNVPKTPTGKRQYESTRWDICIRSCTPRVSGQNRMGAAGWYTNSDYANVAINDVDGLRLMYGGPVSGTTTFRVKGDKPLLNVAIDARAHGMDPGMVIYQGAGANAWRTITLDTTLLANGPHRLFIRTDHKIADGTSSGVFVLPFTVEN
jgi:hypothetical protein